MPDRSGPAPEPWSIGALHDHFERRFCDLERFIEARFEAQEKAITSAAVEAQRAVDKAERLAETRAAQQNEWRATVTDLTQTMMPRAEYIVAQTSLVEKVNDISGRLSSGEGGKEQTNTIIPWVIATGGVVVGLVSLLIDFTH